MSRDWGGGGACGAWGRSFYHFVPVAIKNQHATAVLRRHKNLSFSSAQRAIDLLLSRRHNEGASRLQQLVQHRALGLLDGAFVRVLANDLKQLHGLIRAGLHHASALKRHHAPKAQREARRLQCPRVFREQALCTCPPSSIRAHRSCGLAEDLGRCSAPAA